VVTEWPTRAKGVHPEPGEDHVVMDVLVLGEWLPPVVSENVVHSGEALLLGDVENRFLPVHVTDDEHALVVTGLHRVVNPSGVGIE